MKPTVRMMKPRFRKTIVLFGEKNIETAIPAQKRHALARLAHRFPDMTVKKPPQNEPPTYPAGIMNHLHPPTYFVTPPSFPYTSIPLTLPHVNQQAVACPISWTKTAISFIGFITCYELQQYHVMYHV
mmetsp:Transcript_16429/g.36259  ORF Transcript_16429/g.36259 Transcript_16429/m.36259 type:complete len:128 (+) Transcript_16429:472-855(+)